MSLGQKSTSEAETRTNVRNFSAAKAYYASHCAEYCSKVIECIKARLSWSNLHQLRDITFFLASQEWQKAVDESDPLEAVDRLVQHSLFHMYQLGLMWKKFTPNILSCNRVHYYTHCSFNVRLPTQQSGGSFLMLCVQLNGQMS